MNVITSPFGGVDEQATIEHFYDLHGRDVAEDLDRIYQNNKYSKDWTKYAIQQGYSPDEILDFKVIQNL
jgi:hypothetical protein